jgi:hypothetical protein
MCAGSIYCLSSFFLRIIDLTLTIQFSFGNIAPRNQLHIISAHKNYITCGKHTAFKAPGKDGPHCGL